MAGGLPADARLNAAVAAHRALLPDGRWHFQHGPIDLVIQADGAPTAVAAAHAAAWRRFEPLLDELVAELPLLRRRIADADCPLRGPVARRMWAACAPFSAGFVTPMAAVAGAVAQEVVACYAREGVDRAWVNNGGDIAFHLAPGRTMKVGLYADLARLDAKQLRDGLALDGRVRIDADLPVRGLATSGWRGRSFSLGIADSVTVLAATAAQADAAATIVANAVAVDDPRITRAPACTLRDDSDLGEIEVTVDVPLLSFGAVRAALDNGARCARALRDAGLAWSAVLACQGQVAVCDPPGARMASRAADGVAFAQPSCSEH